MPATARSGGGRTPGMVGTRSKSEIWVVMGCLSTTLGSMSVIGVVRLDLNGRGGGGIGGPGDGFRTQFFPKILTPKFVYPICIRQIEK